MARSAENQVIGVDRCDLRQANLRLAPRETLTGVLDLYDLAAKETDATIAEIADLGQPVPVPQELASWLPGVTERSVRWILLHLVEETARHAGHADIIRESLGGATPFPLMAAAEGWAHVQRSSECCAKAKFRLRLTSADLRAEIDDEKRLIVLLPRSHVIHCRPRLSAARDSRTPATQKGR